MVGDLLTSPAPLPSTPQMYLDASRGVANSEAIVSIYKKKVKIQKEGLN